VAVDRWSSDAAASIKMKIWEDRARVQAGLARSWKPSLLSNRRGVWHFTSDPRAAIVREITLRGRSLLEVDVIASRKKEGKKESMKPIGPLRRPVSPAFPRCALPVRPNLLRVKMWWSMLSVLVTCECVTSEIPSSETFVWVGTKYSITGSNVERNLL